jgi:TPR repeat protein
MKGNKLFVAISMAIGSSAFFHGSPDAKAADLVALQLERPGARQANQTPGLVKPEVDDKRLLAYATARLTAATQPLDFRVAYRYFERAARMGNAEAQFQLAIMQLDNPHVYRDEETAIRWLEKASRAGHRQAAVALDYVVNSGGDIGC